MEAGMASTLRMRTAISPGHAQWITVSVGKKTRRKKRQQQTDGRDWIYVCFKTIFLRPVRICHPLLVVSTKVIERQTKT